MGRRPRRTRLTAAARIRRVRPRSGPDCGQLSDLVVEERLGVGSDRAPVNEHLEVEHADETGPGHPRGRPAGRAPAAGFGPAAWRSDHPTGSGGSASAGALDRSRRARPGARSGESIPWCGRTSRAGSPAWPTAVSAHRHHSTSGEWCEVRTESLLATHHRTSSIEGDAQDLAVLGKASRWGRISVADLGLHLW